MYIYIYKVIDDIDPDDGNGGNLRNVCLNSALIRLIILEFEYFLFKIKIFII
jgi:hypothetical protein